MAYQYSQEKEHAFITIGKDIKEGNIPRLVLLCGQEEYLIQWYMKQLTDRYVSEVSRPIDLVILEGEQLTFDHIREGLETISLMSDRKVVVLPDFLPAVGKTLKGFSEGELKELIAYFENIPEGSMLLMTASAKEDVHTTKKDLDKIKKNKVRSAVEKYGKVYDFEPLKDRRQLRGFIEKRFRAAGKGFMPSITDLIVSQSGYGSRGIDYSLYELDNDLQKIIAHSGAAPEITAADVCSVITMNPENNVFAMLDAIGRNRKDEALRLLHNLLSAGTGEIGLIWRITEQLELILAVKEMREERLSLAAMQKELGVHEFKIKKAAEVTGNFSMEDLHRVLHAAYEAEEHIKTGLFSGPLALEYFIAKI